jgi:ABC-type transporter Mla subunit MlaD
MEVAYDVKDFANYLTFSQINEPGDGYPYNTILSDLIYNPTMTEAQLASTIVARYGEYYTSTGQTVTQSAVNLSQMDNLVSAVNSFSTTAQNVMTNERENFITARTNTVEIASGDPDYKDIYEYMNNVQALTNDASVQAAASAVKNAHANAVVAKTDVNLTTYGLNIWLPADQEYFSYIDTYRALAYGSQLWDEFLEQLIPLTH